MPIGHLSSSAQAVARSKDIGPTTYIFSVLQTVPQGSKLALYGGHLLHRLIIKKNLNKSSETMRPKTQLSVIGSLTLLFIVRGIYLNDRI